MKAVVINEKQELVWSEVADPIRRDGEIVIDVRAAALNRADLLQRVGKYPPPAGWPEWPGLECAGVVCEAAPESCWKIGDKVCALLGGGGYAEKVAVPEGMVMPLPRNLSFAEGASLPEAFATSFLNLFLEAKLQSGETILVQAGASGLGIAAIQTAKAFGAKVMTTVSSPEKEAAVKSLGADYIVNRNSADLASVMAEHPVNVALDCIGGASLGKYLEQMAVGGRWILISTLGGITSEIALRPILKRGLTLKGSTLRSRSNAEKSFILSELVKKVWPKIESGAIRPLIFATFPMTEATAAHAVLEERRNIGKVVLTRGSERD